MRSFFLITTLLLPSPLLAAAATDAYVSVRGEGEVKAKPDKALVSLSVQSKGKDAKAAQALNAKEMARVQKLLRGEFSVDEKDIQTTGFSVSPDYRYEQNGKQTFLGYQVHHGLNVTVKKLDQLGAILDKAVGKNTEDLAVLLGHVGFDTSKRKELEIEALGGAMENARQRAEALAKFAKRGLKRALRISDSSVQVASPPYAMLKGASRMEMAQDASAGTSVSTGEIVVSSNVAVDYELD